MTVYYATDPGRKLPLDAMTFPLSGADKPCPAVDAAMQNPRMQQGRLEALVNMVGEAAWPEILDQVRTDLLDARRALAEAKATRDRMAIRAQTHVLIAVAGTVGGIRVQRLAEGLNRAAHTEGARLMPLCTAALGELDHLLGLLAQQNPERSVQP